MKVKKGSKGIWNKPIFTCYIHKKHRAQSLTSLMADFSLDMTQGENFFEEIASLRPIGALIQMKRVQQL